MTTRSINSASKQNFVPKIAIPDPDLSSILKDVSDTISPVFPLKDYVAVNPFFGMSGRTFLGARAYLRVFSECELLMPLSYYAEQYRAGRFHAHDIEQALQEILWPSSITPPSTSHVVKELFASTSSQESSAASANSWRQIRTIAEHVTNPEGMNWLEAIRDEITKHCSTHFDNGQATWQSPFRAQGLYVAWRRIALIDRNMEILGLRNMRKLVDSLPYCPEDTIKVLLNRLGVPESMWLVVLLCEAFTILGWCSWAKYQDDYRGDSQQNLVSLLAIRLAYDVALAESSGLTVDWNSYRFEQPIRVSPEIDLSSERSWIRYVALVASEISYRNKLFQSLEQDRSTVLTSDATCLTQAAEVRPTAQLVFCIDVRSERYRRHLESICESVRTFGFAGFFGIPMEFQGVGGCSCNPQLPVLLKSQLQVVEQPMRVSQPESSFPQIKMTEQRLWNRLWDSFQTSAVGCFGCVETTGLAAVMKLLRKSLRIANGDSRKFNTESPTPMKLVPLWKQSGNTLTIQQQADLTERILRNIGLTKDMARLVVFCGHESQTENNPLAAGLDCGACGGHSGEPNARLAAQMLNQLEVRIELAERGIPIPSDTYFLAAVHNTTTDEIRFCDSDLIPESHQSDVQSLRSSTEIASRQAALDRLKDEGSISAETAIGRARDWSEVRPEWGLAGNAAMIVGPRELTRNSNLEATTFLHSYDYKADSDGTILETIMTAPMVVANWINMQYYASTVDNLNFGSGNKTLHNVVGQFGILSGNAGDLRTGLPWQSIHNGQRYQHLPLRLLVLIAAPADRIEHIIRKHALVENLATNGWLQIVSLHEGVLLRYDSTGKWISTGTSSSPS